MKYFGVPTCPYCKKRVNIIRTWSLKRQGEYKCPRCGGISNIFLSPLIYVFALLAVFAGGALYFFHKFILDDITLSIVAQVIIPFAAFFLLSLFMVYLEKPVIKKVPRSEMDKGRRAGKAPATRRTPATESRVYYDDNDYLPQVDYRTGPLPQEREQEIAKTSVVKLPENTAKRMTPEGGYRQPVREAPTKIAAPRQAVPASESPRRETSARVSSSNKTAPVRQVRPVEAPVQPASKTRQPQAASSVFSSSSSSTEDFFAKYDDPEYVERRLQELEEQRKHRT